MKKLIIIPAYNEEENIERTIKMIEKGTNEIIRKRFVKKIISIMWIYLLIWGLVGLFKQDINMH